MTGQVASYVSMENRGYAWKNTAETAVPPCTRKFTNAGWHRRPACDGHEVTIRAGRDE